MAETTRRRNASTVTPPTRSSRSPWSATRWPATGSPPCRRSRYSSTGNGTPFTVCHQWGAAVLHDLISTIRPDVVITSDLPNTGSTTHPKAGSQGYADIGAGMATYWTQLEDHGISVVPIQETPVMGYTVPDCVAKYGASSAKCDVKAARAIVPDPPTVLATRDMAGKVKEIDMNDLICEQTRCRAVVGNVLVYFDGHHLTASYSKTLAAYLKPRLLASSPAFTG